MSQALTLNCHNRTELGTSANRRLRRKHQVPGVIYGLSESPQNIHIELKDLTKQLENRAFYSQIITLQLDNTPIKVVLKALQRHPAKETPLHADFLRIDANKPIRKVIGLRFINESSCVGVKIGGGSISHQLTEVEVVCLPEALPEQIDVDMESVAVGQIIHLSDLVLPPSVSLVELSHGEDHNLSVVLVKAPKGVTEDASAPDSEASKNTDSE